MITLLTGENSFEATRALQKIAVSFDGVAERIDGSELDVKQVPDLLMGVTLFSEKRLVIIKNLSENKSLWNDFGEWITRLSDDVHLVLVESKPDKRTKTYKELQKVADVHEFAAWTERDTPRAEQWVMAEAQAMGFAVDKKNAHTLVARVGVDQWSLHQALNKLAVAGDITTDVIEDLIEANPTENVFHLFEAALQGNTPKIRQMIETLELGEDPYRLFGLLSGQAFQLAALTTTDKPSAEVAKDLGVHPYALSKLSSHAKRMGRGGARKIIAAFAQADEAMKSSADDPWLLVERALLKVTTLG